MMEVKLPGVLSPRLAADNLNRPVSIRQLANYKRACAATALSKVYAFSYAFRVI